MKAFQDYYPENLSHCYGCGSLNHHGHQIKTFWDGEETVTRYMPESFHTALPATCLLSACTVAEDRCRPVQAPA